MINAASTGPRIEQTKPRISKIFVSSGYQQAKKKKKKKRKKVINKHDIYYW